MTNTEAIAILTQKSYEEQFADLWDSLNAKRGFGWDTNPWVWVYEFERIGAE